MRMMMIVVSWEFVRASTSCTTVGLEVVVAVVVAVDWYSLQVVVAVAASESERVPLLGEVSNKRRTAAADKALPSLVRTVTMTMMIAMEIAR